MGKSRRLEDRLAALNDLRTDPTSEQSLALLRKALATKTNMVVGRAAEIAGDYQLHALEPAMVQAFGRFMINPQKTDPVCIAKIALVEALYRMEAYQPDLFLTGIGHVQMEPVWGGREDTAAKLRGLCALGLVRINYDGVMLELAQLLADPEPDARISAARAIAYSGMVDEGELLLRFKTLVGDDSPQVLSECLSALLQLVPESALSFVAGFLHRDDPAVQGAAAVALGESHLVQAFPFLETAWEDALGADLKKTLLLSIALLRHERALEFLVSLLASGGQSGKDALEALGMYRDDERIWSRVEAVIREDVQYHRD
jgi:hypothetical protein